MFFFKGCFNYEKIDSIKELIHIPISDKTLVIITINYGSL